jgi:hypothetical protein
MPQGSLEPRLEGLIHDTEEIKRQIHSANIQKGQISKEKPNRWKTRGNNVSLTWQGASATMGT